MGIFGQYLKNADANDPEQIKKLSRIAEITENLDCDECQLFEGALNAESVSGLDDVITIGERLDQYVLIPEVTTDHRLGVYLVETSMMPFDESVQLYLDYSRIGVEYYQHTVALTRPEVMWSGGTALSRN